MAFKTEEITNHIKKHKRNKSRVSFEEELINKETDTEVLTMLNKSDTQEKVNEVKSKKSKSKGKTKSINEHEIGEIIDVVEDKADKRKKKKSETEIINDLQEQNGIDRDNELITKNEKKQKKKKSKLTNGNEFHSEKFEKSSKNKRKIDNPGKGTQPKQRKTTEVEESEQLVETNENDMQTTEKTEESIRAMKRKKHQKHLEEKKKKVQLATQENVLNYLSKWKHARNDWKFEKLKQIWLSNNVFDSSKIPDDFWETAVEYFSGSRGFIRNLIVREALKIIESEDKAEEQNFDEDYQNRLKRARDIVQTLQE